MSARLAVALLLAAGAGTATHATPAASAIEHRTAARIAGKPLAAPDTGLPGATLLYQNFPNPFPGTQSPITCIWFDLETAAAVSLEVYDLRGNLVRTLIPSSALSGVLPAGRYGRAVVASGGQGSGCDQRLTWDGTADGGGVVAPGVYLLRMRAGGTAATRTMVFRGR